MADNLPLIPNKKVSAVQGVLREVLDEQTARLPALHNTCCMSAAQGSPPPNPPALPPAGDGVRQREAAVRATRAAQLVPPPHLTAPPPSSQLLLQRSDLMPPIHKNAMRKTTLWVRNILSNAEEEAASPCPAPAPSSARSLTPRIECISAQSISIGEPAEPERPQALTPPSRSSNLPECIVCVPPTINFVNFTPGEFYSAGVRLINVSREEVRLSMRAPALGELGLQMCGRMRVTSGASIRLVVNFQPRELRDLHDRVIVRASAGQQVVIPITCYLVPPLLDVLVPNMAKSSVLSCELVATPAGRGGRGVTEGGEPLLDLGARLLGQLHFAPLLLRSTPTPADFFILTDDAWISQSMSEVSSAGAVVSGPFVVWPCWWSGGGGGLVRGGVACAAGGAGLHSIVLRLLTSISVMRPLHIIADSLYFHPEHISLQAQEKDYDILSDADPSCEYYVNLGIAFPHRKLSASVDVINHSPLTYSFYWSVREWGVCTCEEMTPSQEDEVSEAGSWAGPVCPGREAAGSGGFGPERALDAAALGVQPLTAVVAPRSLLTVHVAAADVGIRLGVHRAVLLLIIKDVPRKSFPPGSMPQVVSTKTIPQERLEIDEGGRGGAGGGDEAEGVEVCEVVVCQLEVWWTVAPLRFVLDPPYIQLPYSRRQTCAKLCVRATQLYSGGVGVCQWAGAALPPAPPGALTLSPGTPALTELLLPLTPLPNEYPHLDVTKLEAAGCEWSARAAVLRHCALRHPALRPARLYLGVMPPGTPLRACLTLTNDTHQHIYWWLDVFRVRRERPPKTSAGCSAQLACTHCFEQYCSCDIISPTRGGLLPTHSQHIKYQVTAPNSDGVVLTLVRVRRTEAGVCRTAPAPAVTARSTLLCYRVMAPAVSLTVVQCSGPPDECGGCALAGGGETCGGVLRPARALVAGLRTCYRLRVRNLTSVPTYVHWQPPPDGDDSLLRIIFIPDQFALIGYAEIQISVVLEARRVCGRRVWVRQAAVQLAYQPVYLVVDAAIAGLEIEHWIPLCDEMICLRRMQREVLPWHEKLPTTPEEAFLWDDNKRAFLNKALCRCRTRMLYVPPPPPPARALNLPSPAVSVVWSPRPLTRVCACWSEVHPPPRAPALPVRPIAIQFRRLSLYTESTQTVRLRNTSQLTGKWRAAMRLGTMPKPKRTFANIRDPWSWAVRPCGVALRLGCAGGVLPARAATDVVLRAYADTWGLYHDQLLIMIEHFSPLVVDVWVEATGCPLYFPLREPAPAPAAAAAPTDHQNDNPPVIWMTERDTERAVCAVNRSQALLCVQAYMLRDHGMPTADALPFRLLMRLFDVPPPTCPCTLSPSFDSASGDGSEYSELLKDMDTGVEVYLAPDYGVPDDTYYTVTPEIQTVSAGARAVWTVARGEGGEPLVPPPPHTLLLRVLPLEPCGPGWSRAEPAPAAVHVRAAERPGAEAALRVSHAAVTARVCALMLPEHDVLRVRKHIMLQNMSPGPLSISARIGDTRLERAEDVSGAGEGVKGDAEEAGEMGEAQGVRWAAVRGERRGPCAPGCLLRRGARTQHLNLELPPNSSTELVLEAEVHSEGVCPPAAEWPAGGAACEGGDTGKQPAAHIYPTCVFYTSRLDLYDDYNVQKSVSLHVRVERPALHVRPALLELGYVCDDDVRKTYFEVSHTSPYETVAAWVTWTGAPDFCLFPRLVVVAPRACARVYVQYLARYTAAIAEGYVEVRAGGWYGAWCRARVRVCARAARDFNCHRPPHDHTDSAMPPPGPLL